MRATFGPTMNVAVHWIAIDDARDPAWQTDCGLYAYCTIDELEILYIGKVDGTSIRRRWNRSGKGNFWDDLEKQRGIFQHCLLVGEVDPAPGLRLTRQFVADIESLLIRHVLPWGNIQCRETRITRPGLRVRCLGDWPLAKREFRDTL